MMEIKQLKKEFIVEDELSYWKSKKEYCESLIREWIDKNIKVVVYKGKVVNIYGVEESLDYTLQAFLGNSVNITRMPNSWLFEGYYGFVYT